MPDARRRRRLLATLLGILLTAVLLELGTRLLDVARGQPWSVERLRAELDEQCRILGKRAYLPRPLPADTADASDTRDAGRALLQPFTGWEHLVTHGLIVADVEYYRSEEARAAYDVCILGGSVARDFGVQGAARLVECLQADPRLAQREVRVHNYGFGAYKQPQMTTLLAYLLALGHAPDAVIEIDGFNEAALGFNNAKLGGHPLYPYLPLWAGAAAGLRPDWELGEHMHEVREAQDRALSFAEGLRDSGLWRSSLVAHLGLRRVASLRGEYAAAYRRFETFLQTGPAQGEHAGPRFEPGEKALVNLIANAWEQCALSLHGICAGHGIDYLHVLQPALHAPSGHTPTESELAHAVAGAEWIEGVQSVYPRLREAGPRLAAAGIAFYDATGVFDAHPEDVYVDLCHLGQHGNEILAEAIAREFLAKALRH